MPTQQEQIDFLIREVNKLNDAGCGCEECSGGGTPSPALKFNWGVASPTQVAGDYYREIAVENQGKFADMNIYNLEIDVANFADIEQYNPVLLIDRFRYRERKSLNRHRKAGYKHEPANINNRLNEIPITATKQVINFGQENYFSYNGANNVFKGSGMTSRYNSPGRNEFNDLECFVHLGFRIRLTIDGVDVETNHLGYLRMELNRAFGQTRKRVTLKYRYA